MTNSENSKKTAPSHFAYVVEEYKSGKEVKSSWTRVGVVFMHEDGEGFDIKIKPGLALSGRVTVRPPLPEKDADDATGE